MGRITNPNALNMSAYIMIEFPTNSITKEKYYEIHAAIRAIIAEKTGMLHVTTGEFAYPEEGWFPE